METLEQLINGDLMLAFENLRFAGPDRLIRRYVAFAKRDFAAKIVPELRERGLVSAECTVPTRQCLRCLEEYFASGSCPTPNCRSFDPQHPERPVPGENSCLISRILRDLPTTAPNGKVPDQT